MPNDRKISFEIPFYENDLFGKASHCYVCETFNIKERIGKTLSPRRLNFHGAYFSSLPKISILIAKKFVIFKRVPLSKTVSPAWIQRFRANDIYVYGVFEVSTSTGYQKDTT